MDPYLLIFLFINDTKVQHSSLTVDARQKEIIFKTQKTGIVNYFYTPILALFYLINCLLNK